MQEMTQIDLEKMSSRELQELHGKIETAIRAAIREKNLRLSGHAQHAQSQGQAQSSQRPDPQPTVDLAAERDAWLAAKRRG